AHSRFWIKARVFSPGFQIAPGNSEIDAGHAERPRYPRLCEAIRDRDFAELDITTVLHARLVNTCERARGQGTGSIPVLSDWNCEVGARSNHRPWVPVCSAKGVQIAAA